jgi:membrane-associated phospholipid phosphatase
MSKPGIRRPLLRRSEWVLLAYLAYTSLLALVLPVTAQVRGSVLAMNVLLAAALLFAAWVYTLRQAHLIDILRDWFTLAVLIFGYREIGWFAPAEHTYELEHGWIYWDRLLLNHWGLREAIEALGPVIPSLLEASYTLVYTLAPFSVVVLYLYRYRNRMDRLFLPVLSATFLTYALYPYFPSEPPWTVFPGEDMPRVETIFRAFNRGMVGGYGIHTSVFPSAHVSTAFATSFAMIRILPERPWVGRFLLAMSVIIAVATVYGRYHYAVDAVAGFAVALFGLGVMLVWERRAGVEPATR